MSLSFKLTYNTKGFFFKQKTPTIVNYLYKTSKRHYQNSLVLITMKN